MENINKIDTSTIPINNDRGESERYVTVPLSFIEDFVRSSLVGQNATSRLDSIIRYVASTDYVSRETILAIAGVDFQKEFQREDNEPQSDKKE